MKNKGKRQKRQKLREESAKLHLFNDCKVLMSELSVPWILCNCLIMTRTTTHSLIGSSTLTQTKAILFAFHGRNYMLVWFTLECEDDLWKGKCLGALILWHIAQSPHVLSWTFFLMGDMKWNRSSPIGGKTGSIKEKGVTLKREENLARSHFKSRSELASYSDNGNGRAFRFWLSHHFMAVAFASRGTL